MVEDLKILWLIQQVDIEIAKLDKEKKDILNEIKLKEGNLNKKIKEVEEENKKYKEVETSRKKLEIEVEGCRDKLKKYKGQLLQVKTNEEYQALLHEINTEEAKISAYEEEILSEYSKGDDVSKKIEKLKTEIKKVEENLTNFKNEKNQRIKEIDMELNSKKLEKKKFANNISRTLLLRYEQISKSRNGIGIVKVEDNFCTGCNAVLPPQFIAELAKGDKIMYCEQCGRFLIWKDNV